MIATEYIYTVSSAQDLAQQLADKLAEILGWEAVTEGTGASVKRDGLALYFKLEVSGTKIILQIRNVSVALSSNTESGRAINYTANYFYGVTAFISAGGTIAVGISQGEKSNQSIAAKHLQVAIAQTQGGEYVGVVPQPHGEASKDCYMLSESGTAAKQYFPNIFYNLYTFNSSETVIRQMPYMWGGTMFKDLYEIAISSTNNSNVITYNSFYPSLNSTRLFANGTYYRVFGMNFSHMGIAIEDIA